MNHVKQKDGLGTCGAVAYAAILGLSELQGIRECKTKMRKGGTKHFNVIDAFEKRGIKSHLIMFNGVKMKELFWIEQLSMHFPLWVVFRTPGKHNSHAIAIGEGSVYDGHNETTMPLELYENKKIEMILVIDKELPSYGKQ